MPNTLKAQEALSKARRDVSATKYARVVETLRKFQQELQPVSVTKVAEAAGVSRQFIYTYPELKLRVDVVKDLQVNSIGPTVPQALTGPVADVALRGELRMAHLEIKRLRTENKDLKHSLRLDLGAQLEASRHQAMKDSLSAKTAEVDKLNSELQKFQLRVQELESQNLNLREDLTAERRVNLRLATERISLERTSG